jgi:hypothetical protein
MAIDTCDVCGCVHANFSSNEGFKVSVGRALCALIAAGGGGGGGGPQVNAEVLCDDPGVGSPIPFIRRITTSTLGVNTTDDFELDGVTPYVVVGTVENCCCENVPDAFQALVLLDDNGATSTAFIRQIELDELGNRTIVDTTLDGTTAYVTTGVVKAGDVPSDVNIVALLDDNGATSTAFLRHVRLDSEGVVTIIDTTLDGTTLYVTTGVVKFGDVPQALHESILKDTVQTFIRRTQIDQEFQVTVSDWELDGTTPYVTVGAVTVPSSSLDNQALVLLDDNGATSTAFIRHIRINSEGAVTIVDTTLDGTTAYVTTGTVKAGDVPAALHEHILEDEDQTFIRRVQIDSEGVVTITDWELDGTTAYVTNGTVTIPKEGAVALTEVIEFSAAAIEAGFAAYATITATLGYTDHTQLFFWNDLDVAIEVSYDGGTTRHGIIPSGFWGTIPIEKGTATIFIQRLAAATTGVVYIQAIK